MFMLQISLIVISISIKRCTYLKTKAYSWYDAEHWAPGTDTETEKQICSHSGTIKETTAFLWHNDHFNNNDNAGMHLVQLTHGSVLERGQLCDCPSGNI